MRLSCKQLIDSAADLLLGAQCPGCGYPGWSLCSKCVWLLQPECLKINRKNIVIPCWAAHIYQPPLSNIITSYKDHEMFGLVKYLAQILRSALVAAVEDVGVPDYLVPVPSSKSAIRERGLDHSVQLTKKSAQLLGIKMKRILAKSHDVADQVGLSAEQRQVNIAGSMKASLGQGRVIICDDVVTTGATISEAIRALHAAGFQVLAAAVCAETIKVL